MDLNKRILAAQGYAELGMAAEALAELDAAGLDRQNDPDLMQARLQVCVRAKRWEAAVEVGRRLCRTAPELSAGFIHTAFCLHELGRTREARETLLQGPPSLQAEPTYHYNLGCYDAVLGAPESALTHLRRSFALDEKFRHLARLDPDLESVRDTL